MRSFLIIITFLLSLSSCSPLGIGTPGWKINDDLYLFIEFRVDEDGRLINGHLPETPSADFPGYMFDPFTGVIASKDIPFVVDENLKVVFGRSNLSRGAAGSGISGHLEGIYRLPWQTGELTIRGVGETGVADFKYNGERITLEPGGEWSRTVNRTDTITVNTGTAVVEYWKTYRISNRGILEKEKIRKW